MHSRPLLGQTLTELTAWVTAQGQPAYRAKQLHQWLYQRGVRQFQDITVFPKSWREQAQPELGRSHVAQRWVAQDGTVKYLLQLHDGHLIETVGIPSADRLTVCVSSQVGCPMACDFCATGKQGFTRNLAVHEILDQVLTVQTDMARRVSHLVFMGMGEPLLNLDALVTAIHRLHQDCGISQRAMTISTVGGAPANRTPCPSPTPDHVGGEFARPHPSIAPAVDSQWSPLSLGAIIDRLPGLCGTDKAAGEF